MSDRDRPSSGILSAASLIVSVAIAYAIETGLVSWSWSWWWLALTAAPFVAAVLVTTGTLLGIAAIFAWAARQMRRGPP